ncbi:MAG: alpha/beta family hydrolase [Candidatus Eisenbacteria bacterium]
MTQARKVEAVLFSGPVGVLEGLWGKGSVGGAAIPAAIICHPHPAHRGSMHSKVVHTVYRVLEARGHPTLRFNFRGAGTSEGKYSGWDGEIGDLEAAAAYARGRMGSRPLWIAGFSFGSWIGLNFALRDPDVELMIGLGIPASGNADGRRFEFLDQVPWPFLMVQGDHDKYGSVDDIVALRDRLAPLGRVELRIVASADHFFTGKIEALREALNDGIRALTPGDASR